MPQAEAVDMQLQARHLMVGLRTLKTPGTMDISLAQSSTTMVHKCHTPCIRAQEDLLERTELC